jgi:hypothetical protein
MKHFIAVIFLTIFFSSCFKTDNSFGNGFSNNCDPLDANNILICKSEFIPSSTSVKVGTTVTWHNKDEVVHSVIADNTVTFNSGNIEAGGIFSYKTEFPGTYNYHCGIHGEMAVLIVTP